MNFEEYIARFHLLQAAAERDEKNLELMEGDNYRSFLNRFGKTEDPLLKRLIMTKENLKKSIARHQRLSERYAKRLARALSEMKNPYYRDYALCHYLYGFTQEEIAAQNFFCVRTVARHARGARKELEECLLRVMPKVKKIEPKRFTVKGKLPRKKEGICAFSKSIARSSARRKAASIRSSSFYMEG